MFVFAIVAWSLASSSLLACGDVVAGVVAPNGEASVTLLPRSVRASLPSRPSGLVRSQRAVVARQEAALRPDEPEHEAVPSAVEVPEAMWPHLFRMDFASLPLPPALAAGAKAGASASEGSKAAVVTGSRWRFSWRFGLLCTAASACLVSALVWGGHALTRTRPASRLLLELAFPTVLQALFEWSRPLVLLLFALHTSSGCGDCVDVAASAGLSVTLFNCAVVYPTYGFASASDTLTAQAFGSGRMDFVAQDFGTMLRAAVVASALSGMLLALAVLLLAPAIAPAGGLYVARYLSILGPTVPAAVCWTLISRWLRAQNRTATTVAAIICGALLNVALNVWLPPSWVPATARPFAALGITNVLMLAPVAIDAALVFRQLPSCQPAAASILQHAGGAVPLDCDAVRRRHFVRLGLSGTALACGEMFAWEIPAISCVALGPASVAAYSLCFNVWSFLAMLPVGIKNALSVVIGGRIGSGDAAGAREALHTALHGLGVLMVVICPGLLLGGPRLAALLTESPQVAVIAASNFRVVAVYSICAVPFNVLLGALLGIGRQGLGAMAMVLYYVVGLPAALLLAFPLHFGAPGLWLGMTVANVMVCGVVMRHVWRIDFDGEVRAAKAGSDVT